MYVLGGLGIMGAHFSTGNLHQIDASNTLTKAFIEQMLFLERKGFPGEWLTGKGLWRYRQPTTIPPGSPFQKVLDCIGQDVLEVDEDMPTTPIN